MELLPAPLVCVDGIDGQTHEPIGRPLVEGFARRVFGAGLGQVRPAEPAGEPGHGTPSRVDGVRQMTGTHTRGLGPIEHYQIGRVRAPQPLGLSGD